MQKILVYLKRQLLTGAITHADLVRYGEWLVNASSVEDDGSWSLADVLLYLRKQELLWRRHAENAGADHERNYWFECCSKLDRLIGIVDEKRVALSRKLAASTTVAA